MDNKRSFLAAGGEERYYIESPTAEDIRKADWQYSKTYTQCLIEDITTQAKMLDILTRRGIIGPEFEQRADELNKNLSYKIIELEDAKGIDEKERLAKEVSDARNELYRWNQRLTGPMNNTAEQISDNTRLEYLASCMVVDKNGKRVWDSYDNYRKEKSQDLSIRALYEVMLYLQGLDTDFLEKTPEAVAMKEVEKSIINKANAHIEAAKAVADEEEAFEKIVAKEEDIKEPDLDSINQNESDTDDKPRKKK
jgi:hypothetical protein